MSKCLRYQTVASFLHKGIPVLLSVLLLGQFGCSTGPQIIRDLSWLGKRLEEAEKDGAQRCAPYTYAHGRAEYDFSHVEMRQGQSLLAEWHMKRARKWIKMTHDELDVWRKRKEIWKCRGEAPPPPPRIDPCAKDSDNDKIPDCRDRCPFRPEDYQGFEDSDGCPDGDRDSDGDGIPDWKDKCPFEPEDRNGYQDEDGCPDGHIDTDGDGIPDWKDKCPLQYAKTEDGCPQKYRLVTVTKKKIELNRKVFFATARARILIRSFPLLREVGLVLRDYGSIHVCIEGHTDIRGGFNYNIRLSRQRAESVRRFLIREGISSRRIRAKGYSSSFPIAPNSTKTGRGKNRRVEISIVEPGKPCPLDLEQEKKLRKQYRRYRRSRSRSRVRKRTTRKPSKRRRVRKSTQPK